MSVDSYTCHQKLPLCSNPQEANTLCNGQEYKSNLQTSEEGSHRGALFNSGMSYSTRLGSYRHGSRCFEKLYVVARWSEPAVVDFPTPPLPEATAIIWPILGNLILPAGLGGSLPANPEAKRVSNISQESLVKQIRHLSIASDLHAICWMTVRCRLCGSTLIETTSLRRADMLKKQRLRLQKNGFAVFERLLPGTDV